MENSSVTFKSQAKKIHNYYSKKEIKNKFTHRLRHIPGQVTVFVASSDQRTNGEIDHFSALQDQVRINEAEKWVNRDIPPRKTSRKWEREKNGSETRSRKCPCGEVTIECGQEPSIMGWMLLVVEMHQDLCDQPALGGDTWGSSSELRLLLLLGQTGTERVCVVKANTAFHHFWSSGDKPGLTALLRDTTHRAMDGTLFVQGIYIYWRDLGVVRNQVGTGYLMLSVLKQFAFGISKHWVNDA